MPLAKSVIQETKPQPPSNPIETTEVLAIDGIPLDIGNLFDVDLHKMNDKEKSKLKELYEWAVGEVEEKTLGNVMLKIRELERRMGQSRTGSESYNRLWNWVKMEKYSREIKKRQEALLNKITLREVL